MRRGYQTLYPLPPPTPPPPPKQSYIPCELSLTFLAPLYLCLAGKLMEVVCGTMGSFAFASCH